MSTSSSRDPPVKLTEYDYAPIIDELQELASVGVSEYDVFRDFVDVVLATLNPHKTVQTDIYERYTELSSKSIDPEEHFAAALQALLEAYNEVNHDVIGRVYEELEIQNESIGQYFTPPDVTDLMASVLDDTGTDTDAGDETVVKETKGDGEKTVIHDPTCGTGRMLIDAVLEADDDVVVTGVDKSVIAAKMTTINFAVMNTEAHIQHGDSLTLEMHQRWDVAPTPMQLGLISHQTIDDKN